MLTSAGKAAGMDLCLHIVTADHGAAVANELARRLVVPARRAGGQAQFIAAPQVVDTSHAFADLLDWVSGRLHEPLTVPELIASRTGMGTAATLRRHFHRALGVPPDVYRRTFRSHRTPTPAI